MATQIIHFESDPECNGVKLFAYGTDTLSATATSVVMGANDPSHGTCEVEDVAAGLYKVITYDGADAIGYQYVDLLLEDGDFYCRDSVSGDARVSSRAVAGDEMDLVDAPNATAIEAIQEGLSTFDPATDTVARVTLVDTCTANTDMRGTNGAVTSLSGIATATDVADAAYDVIVAFPSVPSAEENATAVWSFEGEVGRTLSSFGDLVATIVSGIWGAANRTLTGFAHKVTVSKNEDKTDYALETAPPTKELIATQVRTELSPELGRIDASVSSRATKASLDDLIEDIESLRDQLDEQDSDLGDIIDDLAAITNVLYQIVGASPGAFPVTLTIKGSGGALLPECDVVLTASNTSIAVDRVWVGRTDVNGVVSPELDAGTYYGWRQKPQYSFTNPFILVVENDGSYTVS